MSSPNKDKLALEFSLELNAGAFPQKVIFSSIDLKPDSGSPSGSVSDPIVDLRIRPATKDTANVPIWLKAKITSANLPKASVDVEQDGEKLDEEQDGEKVGEEQDGEKVDEEQDGEKVDEEQDLEKVEYPPKSPIMDIIRKRGRVDEKGEPMDEVGTILDPIFGGKYEEYNLYPRLNIDMDNDDPSGLIQKTIDILTFIYLKTGPQSGHVELEALLFYENENYNDRPTKLAYSIKYFFEDDGETNVDRDVVLDLISALLKSFQNVLEVDHKWAEFYQVVSLAIALGTDVDQSFYEMLRNWLEENK